MASEFARKLADVALEQHKTFEMLNEHYPKLCKQIKRYWDETIGGFTSCTDVPWAGVFTSWCVKGAGATEEEFKFSASHAGFAHDAIVNPRAFQGVNVASEAPSIGDIIIRNRVVPPHDFEFAKRHGDFQSHSMIVVGIGEDPQGHYALVVGGNEADAIRRSRIAVEDHGMIRQITTHPYICLLKCRK